MKMYMELYLGITGAILLLIKCFKYGMEQVAEEARREEFEKGRRNSDGTFKRKICIKRNNNIISYIYL